MILAAVATLQGMPCLKCLLELLVRGPQSRPTASRGTTGAMALMPARFQAYYS